MPPEFTADGQPRAVLVLSTVCHACRALARDLPRLPSWRRLSGQIGVVISCPRPADGEAFLEDQRGLTSGNVFVDAGGDWCRSELGISIAPALVILEQGKINGWRVQPYAGPEAGQGRGVPARVLGRDRAGDRSSRGGDPARRALHPGRCAGTRAAVPAGVGSSAPGRRRRRGSYPHPPPADAADLSTPGRPGPEPPSAASAASGGPEPASEVGGPKPASEAGDRRPRDDGLPLPAFTVITDFECETWAALAGVLIRFRGMRRAIRRAAPGISAWDSLASMRKMGNARKHIAAAHFAGRAEKVHTGSAIYRNAGHWKQVLWGIPVRQQPRPHPSATTLPGEERGHAGKAVRPD